MLAIDAIFGLPRKKSASVGFQDPLFGNLYFSDQSSVDEFVGTYGGTKDASLVNFMNCCVCFT